jgi:serine/threonine protein phosphatase PrpC
VDRHPLEDIHPVCGRMVESVMNESMKRKSCDNVTVVVIGLTGLLKSLTTENKENR